MRVLFDRRPARSCGSGIGRYAASVATTLGEGLAGHEVRLLGGDLELRVRSRLDEQVALPALLEAVGAQLYHSPLFVLPDVLPCSAAVTIHDAVPAVSPELTTSAFSALFEEACVAAERAAAIVCPSEFARAEVAAALGVELARITVIPEAPAPCFLAAPAALPARAEHAARVLVCVGGFEPRKNQTCLLDALRLLPDARGVFVGAGTDDGRLLDAARARGVADRVEALGRLDDATLCALYRRASAVVVASRHEGFGLPVIEAFAVGAPVIHSSAGALPEVAGDAGLAFHPDDPEGLAACVTRLRAESGLAEALAARGRDRLASRYSLAQVRAGFQRLYDQLQEVAR